MSATERPVDPDPLRHYDMLDRNQPRRLGFMELVVRPFPWILRMFTGKVPGEFIAVVDDGVVEVPCPCKAVTRIPFNVAVPCNGACGRWFWYFGSEVRVGYENASPQDENDEDEAEHQEEAAGENDAPEGVLKGE